MTVAAQIALAASDPARSFGVPKKTTSSATHRSAHHRRDAGPAPHQATRSKEHRKDLVSRQATSASTGRSDKPLDPPPLVGSFSLGVETEQYVKRRSIRGGDYDPDVDGEPKGYRPPYMGFSLKAPLSW